MTRHRTQRSTAGRAGAATAPARRSPAHMRPRRRQGPRRPATLAAGLAAAVVVGAAVAGASQAEPPPTPLEDELAGEIRGMLDAGLPPDHPKVEMVEDLLASLERGGGQLPGAEPGVDVGALLAQAEAEAAARARTERRAGADPGARVDGAAAAGWESGPVLCEPVPGLLAAEDVAGARCVSVPQPDGSARYVAVSPGGVVRSVRFGNDGEVHRLPDARLPAPVAPDAALAPTPTGDLQVEPPGGPAATLDLR
ncbi:MAG TPA: hypothetical protein VFZ77_02045 [Acidimicrobiales bacterium]